jgi:hypothetical protein
MSASTAIGLVSESLRNLLLAEWTLPTAANVTILAPDESGTDPRINLFLYKVMEHPHLANQEWQASRIAPGQLVPPPLSLNLFYLMTAYAANDAQTGNATAHMLLGEAMRIFAQHAIIPPGTDDEPILAPGLQEAREQVKIMFNPLDLDELSRVWSTFSQPFRLSVLYEVSVIQIDQSTDQVRPIPRRVEQIGVPEVRAPYRPPVVTALAPLRGPAGTELTLSGEGLTGWRPTVTLMGEPVAVDNDDLDAEGRLLGNSFQLEVPATLPAGLHEVRVDISHLFRRTFFFEVQ